MKTYTYYDEQYIKYTLNIHVPQYERIVPVCRKRGIKMSQWWREAGNFYLNTEHTTKELLRLHLLQELTRSMEILGKEAVTDDIIEKVSGSARREDVVERPSLWRNQQLFNFFRKTS